MPLAALSSLSRFVKRSLKSLDSRRKPARRLASVRLRLEPLEQRRVLACFVVDTTADIIDSTDELTSLREAIELANTTSCEEVDVIDFDIPETDSGYDPFTGIWTIQPGSSEEFSRLPLPDITEPVEINGISQPNGKDSDGNEYLFSTPNIQLNGFFADEGSHGLSLVAGSDGSTIDGLVINGFSGAGVYVLSDLNSISDNFFGTNPFGSAPVPNSIGVEIFGGSGNQVVNNLISGNSDSGVELNGPDSLNNAVTGNKIGTTLGGLGVLPNAGHGVKIDGASGNTIGGATDAARNIISGNTKSGVVLANFYGATSSNTIQGNFIGTNGLGTGALPNGFHGIETEIVSLNLVSLNQITDNVISGNSKNGVKLADSFFDDPVPIHAVQQNTVSRNLIGLNAAGTTALANAGAGVYVANQVMNNTVSNNTISGNTQGGVRVRGERSELPGSRPVGNIVQGNRIGTNAAASGAIANNVGGVLLADAVDTVIGGLTATPGAGLGNLISGNNGLGIQIDSVTNAVADLRTIIRGNAIGTKADGTSLGNTGDGIRFTRGASNNTVGGMDPQAKNIIAHNGGAGVAVGLNVNDPSVGNAIVRNSIFSNVGLGIDLGRNGVTANDVGDADSGPNHRQNKPVITSVVTSATSTTFLGTINSNASSTFTVEFFDNLVDAQTFLGSGTVTTNASGNGSFAVTIPGTGNLFGHRLTATATDATVGHSADTSEFSTAMVGGDVSGNVQITRSGFTYDRETGHYIQTVTVRNTSNVAYTGPVSLVLDGIAPALLFNKTGTTASGSAYKNLLGNGRLEAGASVSIVLEFTAVPGAFTTRVLEGPGAR